MAEGDGITQEKFDVPLRWLEQSLTHFEKATALDSKLTGPRFNRALCLQALSAPEPAKRAWLEYLNFDADSQ